MVLYFSGLKSILEHIESKSKIKTLTVGLNVKYPLFYDFPKYISDFLAQAIHQDT